LMRWALWWVWYILRLALIGALISFACFHFSQPLGGAIILLITILLVIVAIVARARD
jgi:hypothetical protein